MHPVNLALNLTWRMYVTLYGDWLLSCLTENLELILNGCLQLTGVRVCSYLAGGGWGGAVKLGDALAWNDSEVPVWWLIVNGLGLGTGGG